VLCRHGRAELSCRSRYFFISYSLLLSSVQCHDSFVLPVVGRLLFLLICCRFFDFVVFFSTLMGRILFIFKLDITVVSLIFVHDSL